MSSFVNKLLRKVFLPEARQEPDGSFLKPIEKKWFDLRKELRLRYGADGNVARLKLEEHHEVIKDLLGVTVGKKLGKGSFGWVYKSKDSLRRRFALKVLSPKYDAEDYLKNFFIKQSKQEIYHTANLKHPHIVKMFDYTFLDRPYHVVLKLELLGPTLDKLAQQHPINKKNVTKIFNEIGSAIVYMHNQGTAHHDIKLENIMVTGAIDKQGEDQINLALARLKLKLADFGLAIKYSTKPPVEEKFRNGTLLFCSPGKFDALSYDPFKSDDYAFGCTVYTVHSFTGWPEFDETLKKAQNNDQSENFCNKEGGIIMEKVAEKLLDIKSTDEVEKRSILELVRYDPNKRLTIEEVAVDWK